MGAWELERAEYRLFCLAVTDAVRLAMSGRVEAGYECLRAGLENAQELAESGEEWARGLVEDYQCALRQLDGLVEQQRQAVYRYALLNEVMLRRTVPAGPGVPARSRFQLMRGARPFHLKPRHWLSPN